MRRPATSAMVALALALLGGNVQAHTAYIGYSGAPGTNGTCASSCHGSGGGTIQLSGFPTEYDPGQVYTVTISHAGGVAIRQFNGSCRVGSGSTNAGVIAAGTNTAVYNTTGETNGVHLIGPDLDTATFVWTAPAAGTGDVRLYLGGHQGTMSGANTAFNLLATESVTGVPAAVSGRIDPLRVVSSPNPFRAETNIQYSVAQAGPVSIEILDLNGRLLQSFRADQAAGLHELVWRPSSLGAGMYFCKITVAGQTGTAKLLQSK